MQSIQMRSIYLVNEELRADDASAGKKDRTREHGGSATNGKCDGRNENEAIQLQSQPKKCLILW